MIHELKVWPWYFAALAAGMRGREVRFGDDRQYAVGDHLLFREWDDGAAAYTGRWLAAGVGQAERLEPGWFGAAGDAVWVLGLTAVGPLRDGVPGAWGPGTITLGVAPAGVADVSGCAGWATWVPIAAAEVAHAHAQPEGYYEVLVRQVRSSAGDAALAAWVAACEAAEAGCWRTCVARFELGRVVRYIPLPRMVVTQARPGGGALYEGLALVGGWPEEAA
jgi:hypothetical protein